MSPRNLDDHAQAFERVRPRLRGVAYRMLGSVADAEDAVQDIFVKWSAVTLDEVRDVEAWLVTACTNRCIDILRGAHRTRVDYTGTWLPEPVVGTDSLDLNEHVELASSLTMAFLLLMERLGPVERAAYLLREVFGYAYKDVAFALGKTETACRQIVRRAKTHLDDQKVPEPPAPQDHHALAKRFIEALRTGDVDDFARLLSDGAQFMSDGGGKATAVSKVIVGAGEVAKVLGALWHAYWVKADIRYAMVNGNPGFLMVDKDRVEATVSLSLDETGRFSRIDVVRNPDKLKHVMI